MRMIYAIFMLMICSPAIAESCDTSCGDKCRVKIGFAEFIEPQCNIKCESAKALACNLPIQIPDIPVTPLEITSKIGTLACTVPFHVVTLSISSQCGFSSKPTERELVNIQQAKNILIDKKFFEASEFENLAVYWCKLPSGINKERTSGIVPDRDVIYLDSSNKNSSPVNIAPLLAHEMTHVRQYRQQGTDKFKCDYVRQYAECQCQDRGHSMEREAYEMGDKVGQTLQPTTWRSGTYAVAHGGSDSLPSTVPPTKVTSLDEPKQKETLTSYSNNGSIEQWVALQGPGDTSYRFDKVTRVRSSNAIEKGDIIRANTDIFVRSKPADWSGKPFVLRKGKTAAVLEVRTMTDRKNRKQDWAKVQIGL